MNTVKITVPGSKTVVGSYQSSPRFTIFPEHKSISVAAKRFRKETGCRKKLLEVCAAFPSLFSSTLRDIYTYKIINRL